MRGRTQAWIGGTVAGAAVIGLAVYLIMVGLEDADKLASVIGLFVGLAGLGLAVMAWRREAKADGAAQAVEGSTVGGGITQVTGTGGSVKITRRGSAPSGPPPTTPTPSPGPPSPPASGGQSVRGNAVTGPVDQVSGTGGDVEIEQ